MFYFVFKASVCLKRTEWNECFKPRLKGKCFYTLFDWHKGLYPFQICIFIVLNTMNHTTRSMAHLQNSLSSKVFIVFTRKVAKVQYSSFASLHTLGQSVCIRLSGKVTKIQRCRFHSLLSGREFQVLKDNPTRTQPCVKKHSLFIHLNGAV